MTAVTRGLREAALSRLLLMKREVAAMNMISENVAGMRARASAFVRANPDAVLVAVAGAIGGILAPAIAALTSHSGDLATFSLPAIGAATYFWFALFGLLAAGFSVYIAANSRREDLKHLFFFAIGCGITFPAILVDLTNDQFRQTARQVQAAETLSADSSRPIEQRAAAAEALVVSALESVPADSLDESTRSRIANDTTRIVENLRTQSGPAVDSAIGEIRNQAATSGYSEIVAAVEAAPSDTMAR